MTRRQALEAAIIGLILFAVAVFVFTAPHGNQVMSPDQPVTRVW